MAVLQLWELILVEIMNEIITLNFIVIPAKLSIQMETVYLIHIKTRIPTRSPAYFFS
jgi:hypothetical protein